MMTANQASEIHKLFIEMICIEENSKHYLLHIRATLDFISENRESWRKDLWGV